MLDTLCDALLQPHLELLQAFEVLQAGRAQATLVCMHREPGELGQGAQSLQAAVLHRTGTVQPQVLHSHNV